MADLTLTITEAVTLNGASRGSTNTQTVTGVTEVFHRVIDVGTGATQEVCAFAATKGGGQFADGTVKHLRITNLDATNFVTLQVVESGVQEYSVKLEAGDSFLLGNSVADANDEGTGASATFTNIDSITAIAEHAEVQMELFIAN